MELNAGGTGVMIPERADVRHSPPPTNFKAALWHLVRDSAATLAHGVLL